MGYLTPDENPTDTICRVLFIPNNQEFLANVTGALQTLTIPEYWTKQGALSTQEAADALLNMFDMFCFNQGVCRMVGELITWAGIDAPDEPSLLLCDGSHYSSTDYPELYNRIGTLYGGTGASDFAVPDLRGRVIMSASGSHTVSEAGGAETVTLDTTQIPSHGHNDTGHVHTTGNSATGLAVAPGELPVLVPNPIPSFTGSASANITNTGGGQAHNNMQPYLVMRYYIVAK